MTGTLSCTVAASVTLSDFSALYQMAYPTPEANAPENIAYPMPQFSNEALRATTMLNAMAKGTARRKFSAVARVGSREYFPRKE